MRDYISLEKVYYKYGQKALDFEYKNRINTISTIVLPFTIKSRFNHEYPLFITVTPNMLKHAEMIAESIGKRYL